MIPFRFELAVSGGVLNVAVGISARELGPLIRSGA